MTEKVSGSHDEYEIKLFVPQVYGVEVDQDEIADVIGIQIGQDETYSFWFNNTGNGDDTYTISISELPQQLTPLWSVTGASTLEVPPRTQQGYSVVIHASEVWVGEAEFPVTVTITSEDGNTSETVTLNIKTALPDLEFVDHGSHGLSMDGFAPMGQSMEFFANVKNTGDVDARDVEVIVIDDNGTVVGSLTKDVPMDQTTEFVIDIAAVDELGSVTYTFKINSTAGQMEDTPGEEVLKINYQPTVATESNDWVALIVVLFVAGILGLFWKFSGRRGSQAF